MPAKQKCGIKLNLYEHCFCMSLSWAQCGADSVSFKKKIDRKKERKTNKQTKKNKKTQLLMLWV